ncbi:MAG: hypothetical protein H6560_25825 [Lewinellaceae bacterium]|nr:hypothetical protein [Lewinellaceae bacterium]
MKTLKAEKNRFQLPADKERLFVALENDEQLLKETLEVILALAVSDPKLTIWSADLIASDFKELYLAIFRDMLKESSSSSQSPGCCKDL